MSRTSSAGQGQGQSQLQPPSSPSATTLQRSSSSESHSSNSDGSISGAEYAQLIRCSRCQRVLSSGAFDRLISNGWSTNGSGMVRFGHNLYYCARCASMVGLK